METKLGIPTSLFAPPKKDPMSLYKSQIGFMNIFAVPLFRGVAGIMPTLKYTIDEVELNMSLFEEKICVEVPRRLRCSGEVLPPQKLSLAFNDDLATEGNRIELRDSLTEDRADSSYGQATYGLERCDGTRPCDDSLEINGISTFDIVNKFAASDPFHCHDNQPLASEKQRCSETTEGSNSVPGSGDWGSQATSAITGKMPLSPSTQATSIVSLDSIEGQTSVPVTTITFPDNKLVPEHHVESRSIMEDESNTSSNNSSPPPRLPKTLKKRSSLFRLKQLNFFRKNKTPTPPVPAVPPLSSHGHLNPHETAG